eukprot:gene6240-269_t
MEESIYNLIPREEKPAPKSKRYVSQFADTARQEYKARQGKCATMGPQNATTKDAGCFTKKGTGKGGGNYQRAAPQGRDQTRHIKPHVPKASDKPVMGHLSNKDFLKENAIKTITSKPVKPKATMVDHPAGKGPKIALENSGLVPKFCKKKGYGTTPKYITKRKEEEHRAHEEYEQYIHSVQKQGAYYECGSIQIIACETTDAQVPTSEREELLRGLKSNWEQLHKEYQGLSVIADTAPKRQRRNDMETRLAQLEADIARIERHTTIIVSN